MLPPLLDENQRVQRPCPSLPGIRDLFGEHLRRPGHNPSPLILPPPWHSPFSLEELGSSLPVDSRPASPVDSQSWSTWPQASSRLPGSSSAEHYSDVSSRTAISTSSTQDQFLKLPPISHSCPGHSGDNAGYFASSMRAISSARRAHESHGRSRSNSAAIIGTKYDDSQINIISRRRHTIGPARGHSPMRFSYPTPTASIPSGPSLTVHPSNAPRPSISKQDSSPSLSNLSLPLVPNGSRRSSVSSAPTSGEDLPTERRKTPAKYQCEYCGKRFNRPSSLRIHHNTHTGAKPFACLFPGCGRHFSVMSNMRRHARIHGEIFERQNHEGSEEENLDRSSSYSSASSTHTAPILPQAEITAAFGDSNMSPTSSSPYVRRLSRLPSSSGHRGQKRSSSIQRSYPYNISPSLSSDDESSSEP